MLPCPPLYNTAIANERTLYPSKHLLTQQAGHSFKQKLSPFAFRLSLRITIYPLCTCLYLYLSSTVVEGYQMMPFYDSRLHSVSAPLTNIISFNFPTDKRGYRHLRHSVQEISNNMQNKVRNARCYPLFIIILHISHRIDTTCPSASQHLHTFVSFLSLQ